MRRVLFLCSHNAARSQMAEGFLRALAGDRFVVESAGTIATELHPLAIQAMREVGVDISSQRSKPVDEVGEGWDVVVTVCDANSATRLPALESAVTRTTSITGWPARMRSSSAPV